MLKVLVNIVSRSQPSRSVLQRIQSLRLSSTVPPATLTPKVLVVKKVPPSYAFERLKIAASVTAATLVTSVLLYYASDTRAAIYKFILMPITRQVLDAESAHELAVKVIASGWIPSDKSSDDPCLHIDICGMQLSNPIGLAAGFDKNGECVDGLFNFGFGMVEVGSVTPVPQPGNPKPRMFRLEQDNAVINRYGFNSDGSDTVRSRLQRRFSNWIHVNMISEDHLPESFPKSLWSGRALGINLGKNKKSNSDSNDDYVHGIQELSELADYTVINISSPNTPGLRSLQRREVLENLLKDAQRKRAKIVASTGHHAPPLFVKIAPDLTADELKDIAEVVQSQIVDGVIISNTSISRPSSLKSDSRLTAETGGLSGKPLKPLALQTVKSFYEMTGGKVPIIGCGGISNGQDALDFILAGASVVQLYTAFAYDGPCIVREIKDYLAQECQRRQVTSISQLIGKGK